MATREFDDDTDYEHAMKKCNYCHQAKKLVKNKLYCLKCAREAFRECRRCKKPYHNEKYFELNETRCNTCQRKYLKEKERRELKKSSDLAVKKEPPKPETFSSSDEVESDYEPPVMSPPKKKLRKILLPVFIESE